MGKERFYYPNGDLCYFLVGRRQQDTNQSCLLWRLKEPQNTSCRFVDKFSEKDSLPAYEFNSKKAEEECVCFEKDAFKGEAMMREFEILYSKP